MDTHLSDSDNEVSYMTESISAEADLLQDDYQQYYGDTIFIRFMLGSDIVDCSFFQRDSSVENVFEFIHNEKPVKLMSNLNIELSEKQYKCSLREIFGDEDNNITINIIQDQNTTPQLKPIDLITASTSDDDNTIDLTVSSPEKTKHPVLEFTATAISISSSSSDDLSVCDHDIRLPPMRKRKLQDLSAFEEDSMSTNYSDTDTDSNEISKEEINRRQKGKSRKRSISCSSQFKERYTTIQEVESLPYDIDGDCRYKVKYEKTERSRMKSTKDGRSWNRYNKCFIKGFNRSHGKRLRATCKGSYQCFNDHCPFYIQYNIRNSKHILKLGDQMNCEECESKMRFVRCLAVKIWEFPKKCDYVYVFHSGKHTCLPVSKPELPTEEMINAFKFKPDMKPCEVSNRLLMKYVESSSSLTEVQKVAFSLSDNRKIRNLKQKVIGGSPISRKLLELQEKCLNTYKDPYLLYEFQIKEQRHGKCYIIHSKIENNDIVQDEYITEDPDLYQNYVIKSSKERLEILKNNCDKDSFLGEEWVFADFKENRVKTKNKKMKKYISFPCKPFEIYFTEKNLKLL